MRCFERILVVAPEGADASGTLRRAADLACANGARITLYDVLAPLPHDAKKLFKVVARTKLEKMLLRRRREELEAAVAQAGLTLGGTPGEGGGDAKDGVAVRVEIGTPFIEVIRTVLREGYDLVMKPAKADGKARSHGFGSTDLHLMRECPCAVWIVKQPRAKQYPRVLAAVDPDPTDEDHNRLNDSVMALARSVCELQGSELHVVHAWELYNQPILEFLVGNVDKLVRNTRKTHRRWLYALLERFSVPRNRRTVHLVEGAAKEVIPELARKKRVSLIVIGTASRSGIPHFLIGNTAEDVLNQADCSVLTVKAEGFVSPITLEESP